MSDLIGKVLLNQFRVDAFVAAGGMGAVYKVWDLKRNVPLAMKVLHSDLAEDPSVFKRFQREGRALQKLAHPNIVPFYGLYQTMDFAFMLERFVDGPSLKDVLKKNKGAPLSMQESFVYIKALCAALGYAHANGVVHCDVKPGNVIIDKGGNIYLTDFGIARHAESTTTTMGAAGTPAYMPPEQILGQAVTPATDVYSLGVILFEMLTGQRPFRGSETGTEHSGATVNERIRYGHLHLPPQDPRELAPAISEELSKVILKSLSKDPVERFSSAPQFFDAASAAAAIAPDSVSERTTPKEDIVINGKWRPDYPPTPPNRLLLGLVVAGLLGCAVLATVGVFAFGSIGNHSTPLSATGNSTGITQSVHQPTLTSLPATPLPPPSTRTPDYELMTSAVVLTQAAALPKETKTPSGPNCPGNEIKSIEKETVSGGMYLLICANNKIQKMGPLADGVFEIGPNKKFFVYIAYEGLVYAARVGDATPVYIGEVKELIINRVNDNPKYIITFLGDHPYQVHIQEYWEHQDKTIPIPRYITTPN